MPGDTATAPVELILVRHGETDWNRELRFQGHIDVPLNDMGHEQARRIGLRVSREAVDHVISSDLLRAQQTAAPAASLLSLPVATTVALREQAFGIVDGMRSEDIQREHPLAWEEWLLFREDHGLPGGESPRQFHDRIAGALQAIAHEHAGRTVLVVTHGGVLDMVWRIAHGLSLSGPRRSIIPNAAFNRVRVASVEASLRVDVEVWAEVDHLDALPPQPVYDQQRHLKG
ncbi:MAG: histidine phosphatase family protein [Comamonadaceae bacterium]|nr:MAG: histidine phosphatase family protein [Comamonadaceae bacterium]